MKLSSDKLMNRLLDSPGSSSFLSTEALSSWESFIQASNFLYVLPDYGNKKENGLIMEADLGFDETQSYIAVYRSEPAVLENCIYPIVISRLQNSSSHFTKRNGWKCYQLIYTHSGSAVINFENRIYHLRPGSFFLLDCRPYHYFYADDPGGWEYSLIHFAGAESRFFYALLHEKGLHFPDMEQSRAVQLFERIYAASLGDDADFELRFHAWMTGLLTSLCTEPDRAEPQLEAPIWLSDVQSYIAAHFAEEIRVEELAGIAYLSPGRFAHCFRELMGVSPIDYQMRIRISRSKILLESTNLPIRTVAEKCGFRSEAGYYSKFRKLTGMSPGRYRKTR